MSSWQIILFVGSMGFNLLWLCDLHSRIEKLEKERTDDEKDKATGE